MRKGYPKARSIGGHQKKEPRTFIQPVGTVMSGAQKVLIQNAKESNIRDFDKFMAELLKRK